MNGKLAVGICEEDGCSTELVNPFVHHLELETTYEKIRVSFGRLGFGRGLTRVAATFSNRNWTPLGWDLRMKLYKTLSADYVKKYLRATKILFIS